MKTRPSQELRSLFDHYLNHYIDLFANAHAQRPNAIFPRDLSFVILGLATIYKTTNAEDYCRQIAHLCDILIEFEVPFRGPAGSPASGFLMRMDISPHCLCRLPQRGTVGVDASHSLP